jgi:hypothetical protein
MLSSAMTHFKIGEISLFGTERSLKMASEPNKTIIERKSQARVLPVAYFDKLQALKALTTTYIRYF